METALLILALWFAIAGAALWLDRRAQSRAYNLTLSLELLTQRIRLDLAGKVAEEEPPPPVLPPIRCPNRRGTLQCVFEVDHGGLHESMTGVSWQ